jgi:hypothetical protein
MCHAMIVERIETAELNAAVYRTARRLLDMCNQQTGAARVTHEQMRTIAGTNADGTARNHLHQLQAAGILTYRRDGDVRIWFADWLPGNLDNHDDQQSTVVHSGARTAGNLHSGARVARDSEQSSVHSGARTAGNLHAPRAICTPDVQLPHTHASAPNLEGRKEDPIKTDLVLPSIPVSPDDANRSLSLLRAVRVSPAEAKTLAVVHPFERIRLCVAAWWMNRKSVGGKLENEPGVVVFWLKNWGGKQEPKPFDEQAWRREDLYLLHRTPAELAAELEPPPERPPIPVPAVAQPPPSGYLDTDPGWLAVAADTAAGDELAGLIGIGEVQGLPMYVLQAKDPTRAHYLDNRMAGRLRKVITGAIGCAVQVQIIGETVDGKQTTNT